MIELNDDNTNENWLFERNNLFGAILLLLYSYLNRVHTHRHTTPNRPALVPAHVDIGKYNVMHCLDCLLCHAGVCLCVFFLSNDEILFPFDLIRAHYKRTDREEEWERGSESCRRRCSDRRLHYYYYHQINMILFLCSVVCLCAGFGFGRWFQGLAQDRLKTKLKLLRIVRPVAFNAHHRAHAGPAWHGMMVMLAPAHRTIAFAGRTHTRNKYSPPPPSNIFAKPFQFTYYYDLRRRGVRSLHVRCLFWLTETDQWKFRVKYALHLCAKSFLLPLSLSLRVLCFRVGNNVFIILHRVKTSSKPKQTLQMHRRCTSFNVSVIILIYYFENLKPFRPRQRNKYTLRLD